MAPTLKAVTSGHQDQVGDGPKSKQQPTEFQQMLDEIEAIFDRAEKSVDVDELWRVLENYRSNSNHWSKFAYYEREKYKRNLVAEHQKYNVMILTWGPNTRSCIHDHAGSHCFMKVS